MNIFRRCTSLVIWSVGQYHCQGHLYTEWSTMSGCNSGRTEHKGTQQPAAWGQNAEDATLDSPHPKIKQDGCYAAPAHQIQEIYSYPVGPRPEHSAHASDAGYFFAYKIPKVPASPIARPVFIVYQLPPFHHPPPIYSSTHQRSLQSGTPSQPHIIHTTSSPLGFPEKPTLNHPPCHRTHSIYRNN